MAATTYLPVVVGLISFGCAQVSIDDVNARLHSFQIFVMVSKLMNECRPYLLSTSPTTAPIPGTLQRKNLPLDLSLKIELMQRTLDELKKIYIECHTKPTTEIHNGRKIVTGPWSWNNTGFEVIRKVLIKRLAIDAHNNDIYHKIWLLDVRVTRNMSVGDTWCHDYQTLCSNLGGMKTLGCSESYHKVEEYKTCIRYNMEYKIPDYVFMCHPDAQIALLVKDALTGVSKSPVQLGEQSMGLRICHGSKGLHEKAVCAKDASKNHESVTNLDLVVSKFNNRGYTVCYEGTTYDKN